MSETTSKSFPERVGTHSIEHHRGPFLFCVTRPGKKDGLVTTEWLKGEVAKDEALSEADALLLDPKDTISSISFWSVKEEQFVGHRNRKQAQEARA